ncbi:carbon monoxide dehydrogenase subunit G [Cryptosporangium sp. NPDC051539]|uniref:carbon monoxide dehydrogenase subunit G n=1 Tax=Cryptosporangium sp. NPDC051539 TaxID=3363962 RepID=UPI00379456CF
MKVNGKATLNAPVERVYAALNDPSVLVRTIPGCQQLEQVGDDAYRMTVTAGVASIKGSYVGDVRLTDQQQPTSFVLRAKGSGAPGTVSADVLVTLEGGADGTTLLSYAADAVVGGAVGGVGQRVLSGVAKKTAGEFFAAVDSLLNAPAEAAVSPSEATGATGATEVAGATAAAAAAADVVSVGATGARVFTAPAKAAPAGGEVLAGGFVQGALFGAGIALLGVLVGGLVGRRRA